ncbi:hypothetical protein [Fluviicola sp.]|uniref:hypothetical protein n=1 Tax=Fluviicola sp. TaxID=1917219 RepID=UPI0031D6586B
MKKRLKKALFFVLLFGAFQGYSQTISMQLSDAQIQSRVSEVYGNDYTAQNPSLVEAFGKLLNERISFMNTPAGADEKYPALSSYPLMNKNNPSLEGTDFEDFDLQSFNPLVYHFEFFSDKTQVMRIDNTNYIMIVNPITTN